MLSVPLVVGISFVYLGLLFAIAYWGDKRADAGRSIIASPYVYTLSIAVYCTSWTFFGSVGRAATSGVGFLPIYLGPTLTFILGWVVIRKIIRISKANRITSIADFIASRYGKSVGLGIVVSLIAVVGIPPYISIQLTAISTSFSILQGYPAIQMPQGASGIALLQDTELYVSLLMAAFAILFGTRHIDAGEHHEGLVAAIAFESVVKLVAFLAVGAWVTWGIYNGFGDLFARAAAEPKIAAMLLLGSAASWPSGSLQTAAFVGVALAMGLGSFWGGRRVTQVLAEQVTRMDHAEGLSANLTTSSLVFAAATLGLPLVVVYERHTVGGGARWNPETMMGMGEGRGRWLEQLELADIPRSHIIGVTPGTWRRAALGHHAHEARRAQEHGRPVVSCARVRGRERRPGRGHPHRALGRPGER